MPRPTHLIALKLIACAAVAIAATPAENAPSSQSPAPGDQPKICQMVVTAELGSKPYQLCLTQREWDSKKLADLKDANRIVCHYVEEPGERFRSAKVCMPASQWDEARRLDRESVERIQRDVCVPGAGCH